MAVLVEYVGTFVRELIFFSGDVKTTAIAIAVTSSMCCSVVWLLINLLGTPPQTHTAPAKLTDATKRHSIVSCHLSKKINNHQAEKKPRRSSGTNLTSSKSLWTGRIVENGCAVPCIRCSLNKADKECRYILCKNCCKTNLATICEFHSNITTEKHEKWEDVTCQLKPKHMDLSFLNLARCPDRVGYVGPQLVRLNLSNNCLFSVPIEIGFLLGLQHLDLHNNRLSELPESIRNLRNLEELDICQNKLQSVPSSIGHLHKLQILKLNCNHLKSIPHTMGQLKKLTHLKACNNQLENLPKEICLLDKLETLGLQSNRLMELPGNMSDMVRLAELDVSNNILESLPNNITKCAFLSSLKASHNRLREMPSHMNRLQDLRELYVSDNRLRYLPASIHSLQLVMLNVHKNPLWKEDGLSASPFLPDNTNNSQSFPTLVELSVLKAKAKQVEWREQNLPLEVQELMSRIHYCTCCERPLLENYRTKLEFHSCMNFSQKLPLYQIICPKYYSSQCDFMKLESDT